MYGSGFQTWEYSPTYAIRSYGYLLLHILPLLVTNTANKVLLNFGIILNNTCINTVSSQTNNATDINSSTVSINSDTVIITNMTLTLSLSQTLTLSDINTVINTFIITVINTFISLIGHF